MKDGYQKFFEDTFADKCSPENYNDAVQEAIKQEARTVPGMVGKIGRSMLKYGNAAEVAAGHGCTKSFVHRYYASFRKRMRHPKHSRAILMACGAEKLPTTYADKSRRDHLK